MFLPSCQTSVRFCFQLILTIGTPLASKSQNQIVFVSDTQAPMWVEKVVLGSNQNIRGTGMVFHDILKQRPTSLIILGDVVSVGHKVKTWSKIDRYLDSCRREGIKVSALLGNHDVMTRPRKGETQFQKRFPNHNRIGFYQIVDSVAVVFLNSNFSKLSADDIQQQQTWFQSTLQALDTDPSVLVIIIACHHAPYTNSKIVRSSKKVRHYFVPDFIRSAKSRLFITGHSHNYEHFRNAGKDFLVVGGGGGLAQPVSTAEKSWNDISATYKPQFHYLVVQHTHSELLVTSRFLKEDFSGFEKGISFTVPIR